MRKTQKQQVEQEVTVDILCNKCGESCRTKIHKDFEQYETQYATINLAFEIAVSNITGEAHICKRCYTEFEETFLIKPTHKTWGELV